MAMTLVEKIFARCAGRDTVSAGEVVWVRPDLVTVPEVAFPAYVKRLRGVGFERFSNPDKVVVAIDHEVPAHSQAGAERNRLTRQLAHEFSVGHLFDSEGITHPLLIERGLVRPGDFVAAADSHTAVIGGAGAVGVPFGFETALLMATGQIWVMVPETIRVTLTGKPQPGVGARDIALATMRELDETAASYRLLEFAGEGLAHVPFWDRMTLCGLCIDIGAKSAVVPADAVTVAALEEIGVETSGDVVSDAGARFCQEVEIDLGTLEPLVSVPPSPTHVRRVSEMRDTTIQHAYLGSCASGTLEDLRAADALLSGHKVREGVNMLVIPSTRKTYQRAMEEGILTRFTAAGATVLAPTCGPCFGGLAQLCAGERRISTSTRNDPGRMGSAEAEIFLGSALTVTASAIAGHICGAGDIAKGRPS
jgi:3-isopropylmalate/(R)-2-methylmalate dehydratase large subunit